MALPVNVRDVMTRQQTQPRGAREAGPPRRVRRARRARGACRAARAALHPADGQREVAHRRRAAGRRAAARSAGRRRHRSGGRRQGDRSRRWPRRATPTFLPSPWSGPCHGRGRGRRVLDHPLRRRRGRRGRRARCGREARRVACREPSPRKRLALADNFAFMRRAVAGESIQATALQNGAHRRRRHHPRRRHAAHDGQPGEDGAADRRRLRRAARPGARPGARRRRRRRLRAARGRAPARSTSSPASAGRSRRASATRARSRWGTAALEYFEDGADLRSGSRARCAKARERLRGEIAEEPRDRR